MYPRALKVFIAVLSVVSLGILVVTFHQFSLAPRGAVIILGGGILLASLYSVPLLKGHGSVTVQLPVLMATTIILGPGVGAWVGFFTTLTGPELRGVVRWPSILFNRAQYSITAWLSGETFILLGGHALNLNLRDVSIPMVSALALAFLLNSGFVMSAISLRTQRPLIETFRVHMKWGTPTFLLMLPVSYAMATVYKTNGVGPELFFFVPLVSIRYILALLRKAHLAYVNNIDILLTALHFRDAYTYGHSIRVGHYAGKLAEQFGMPQDRVQLVKEAGLLHDVGKLATPDVILSKVGRLNHEEGTVMKDHPIIGSHILEELRVGGCARHFVRQHHERWDGFGYPDRLTREEIALETRIVSVVDAYDAMTTDRPYRRSLPHSVALKEIERGSDNQFDPEVVQKFVEMCVDKNLVAEETVAQGWNHVGLRKGPDNEHGQSS